MPNAFQVAGHLFTGGGPYLALDSRLLSHWRGADPGRAWLTHVEGPLASEPEKWPAPLSHVYDDEIAARKAYGAIKAQALIMAHGLDLRADRGVGSDGEVAQSLWSNGEPVLRMVCRPVTDLDKLAFGATELFPVAVGATTAAAWRSEPGPAIVATNQGQLLPEHVLMCTARRSRVPLRTAIEAGLPGAVSDPSCPVLDLELPSGILVLAWSAVSGGSLLRGREGEDPAYVLHDRIGPNPFAHLPTSADKRAGGQATQAVRVVPGTYAAYVVRLEPSPGEGIAGLVLSRRP